MVDKPKTMTENQDFYMPITPNIANVGKTTVAVIDFFHEHVKGPKQFFCRIPLPVPGEGNVMITGIRVTFEYENF